MPATVLQSGKTARSGKDGKVVLGGNVLVRIKSWSCNMVASESVWGDSDSLGFTNRKKARLDATGSFVGVLDEDFTIYEVAASASGDFVGQSITGLTLWENWVTGSSNRWYFPCALITSYDITVDMDSKEVVEFTIGWGSDGPFYRPYQSNMDGTVVNQEILGVEQS